MSGAQALEDWRISGASPDSTDAEGSFIQLGETEETALVSHFNRKRPAGEAGRFWGYYREERVRVTDLYICGSVGGRWVLYVPRAAIEGRSMSAIWAAPDPARKILVFPFIGPLTRILEQRTNVCAICV